MAVKIEALSNLSVEHQSEILERMAKFFVESNKWKDFDIDKNTKRWVDDEGKKLKMVEIEVDGIMYTVPQPVNELLNSIYRMYEKEIMRRDAKD